MLEIAEDVKQSGIKKGAKKRARSNVKLSASRLKKMISKLMDNLENEANPGKATVGELLKLLQVYKDLTAEQVKEVEVRWVDRLRPEDEPGK